MNLRVTGTGGALDVAHNEGQRLGGGRKVTRACQSTA